MCKNLCEVKAEWFSSLNVQILQPVQWPRQGWLLHDSSLRGRRGADQTAARTPLAAAGNKTQQIVTVYQLPHIVYTNKDHFTNSRQPDDYLVRIQSMLKKYVHLCISVQGITLVETNLDFTDAMCIFSAIPCEGVFFRVHTSAWRVEKPPRSGDGRVLYRMLFSLGK